MIRRSLLVGLINGLLVSIAGIYPAISLLVPTIMPGWDRPVQSELLHGLLLMVSAGIGIPVLLANGFVAAHRSRGCGWLEGAKAGLIAGVTLAYVSFLLLLSPLNGLAAQGKIVATMPNPFPSQLPPTATLSAALRSLEHSNIWVESALIIAVALGILSGAFAGWYHRHLLPPPPTELIDLLRPGKSPHHWFANNESVLRNGLLVGVGISLFFIPTIFGGYYSDIAANFPNLANDLNRTAVGSFFQGMASYLPILSPIANLSLFTFGFFVVGLSRNPPNCFQARIGGSIAAGLVIFSSILGSFIRISFFFMGLMPFLWNNELSNEVVLVGPLPPAEIISERYFYVVGSFGLAWGAFICAVVIALFAGTIQGFLATLIIPLFRQRPVDEARLLRKQLQKEPEMVFPLFLKLFRKTDNAPEIMAHLTTLTHHRQPDVAQVAAAYHTLTTSYQPASYIRSLEITKSATTNHPQWKWAKDIGSVHFSLSRVLAARTLEQILTLPPPPQLETSSLPPTIIRSVKIITDIVMELHKGDRVADLPTKIIFLENAMAAIHEGQRFISQEVMNPAGVIIMPEQRAISEMLDHWQGLVMEAIKRTKGRADVVCNLQTKICCYLPEMTLGFELNNKGLNVAQKVRLRLLPDKHYQTVEPDGAKIAILSPAESKTINLTIRPEQESGRLRVAWELTYDDAVDAERRFQAADTIEFDGPERPFQRIFPIPYVTGTPLKTDDVFVGRDDVFAFIKENLLGTHQNNVIILHGQRRTGKTSVLYRLGQVMSDTHYGVLIDMQGKPARGELDFLYAIADDIAFVLEEHGIEANLPPRSEFAESPEFYFRARFLRGLYPKLNGKNLLLMFDEFEELQRRVEDGHLKPEIFQFLRNLMQHESQVDFVFSGTHKLEELGATYWSVLFNIAAYKPITFLSPQEVRRLIVEPIANYHAEYDPIAVDRIVTVTAGHPYFTQLVLHEMIVFHNEVQRSYLTVTDVGQVLERIVERGEAHFKYIWAESSPEEQIVLRGLTELLINAETVNTTDLRDFLSKRGQLSADQWAKALTNLESRDILTRQNVNSQLYRFKVDLIRLWIAKTRPGL